MNTENNGNSGPAEIETGNLTTWANEPSLTALKENITDADSDIDKHKSKVSAWLDARNMEGASKPKEIKGRSKIGPKVIRKHAEWRYSSLSNPFLSSDDMFKVSPRTANDRTRAQQNALVLNQQFNTHIPKVTFIDDLVREDVDTGTVIVEVSWITEEEEVTEEVPIYEYTPTGDPQVAERYMRLLEMKQTSQDIYNQYMNPGLDKAITLFAQTGQLLIPQQVGVEEETKTKEIKNHPAVEVCELENILIDPSCNGDLAKAQFIGKRHKDSLSGLRKEGKYKENQLKRILIESNNPLADPDYVDSVDIGTFDFKDEPRKQFVVHTYWGNWDIHNTGIAVPIVAAWVGNTKIRMEENPFPFKRPPFAKAVYMPVRRSTYGEPDAELIEDNQKIIGATTRGMIDLMAKSSNGQVGTRVDFLDTVNRRKFNNGENYQYQSTGAPENSIHQHVFPEIPQSAYNMITLNNNEAESFSGVKAFSSGVNSRSLGDSVGGGRDAMDAASKREYGILLRLKQCMLEVGRMFISMNSEWLSDEEVVRITDEEFITVRRDDLAGKFDLRLNISTAEEDDKQAKELAFMLQTKGPEMDFGLYKMLLSDIARLRKMPDMAKRIEEYEPQPDPLIQKEKELKIVLLEKQIAKENALAVKHMTEASANQQRGLKDGSQAYLNEAKAQTEGAKGRNLHSDSDNKDLDYLEKHDGVNHQRDLEKMDRDAINKLDSDIIKAGLTDKATEK